MTLKIICTEYYDLENDLLDYDAMLQAELDKRAAIEQRLMVSAMRSVGVASYEPRETESSHMSNPTLEAALVELKHEDRAWKKCESKIAYYRVQIASVTQRLIPLRRLINSLPETDRRIIRLRYGPIEKERPTIEDVAESVNLSSKTVSNRIAVLSKIVPIRLHRLRKSRSRTHV